MGTWGRAAYADPPDSEQISDSVPHQPRSQDFCLGGAKPQDNFSDSVARSLRSHNTSSPLSTHDKNYISPRMLKSAIECS